MIRHPEVVLNFVYVGQLELVFLASYLILGSSSGG